MSRDGVRSDNLGSHVMLDYRHFESNTGTGGIEVLSLLRQCVADSGVREVHHHMEDFDGSKSPVGFASVVLIDESHVTAHCYTDMGILAIDAFTCGGHSASSLADSIHSRLVDLCPGIELVSRTVVPRFPVG